jgi:hypothetical protein
MPFIKHITKCKVFGDQKILEELVVQKNARYNKDGYKEI